MCEVGLCIKGVLMELEGLSMGSCQWEMDGPESRRQSISGACSPKDPRGAPRDSERGRQRGWVLGSGGVPLCPSARAS